MHQLEELISDSIEDIIITKDGDISITKTVLVIIASGALLSCVAIVPKILMMLPSKYRTRTYTRRISSAVNYYKKNAFLEIHDQRLLITEKGKRKLNLIAYEKLSISRPKQWDKKWRVVAFDIPEKKRSARDQLRKKIRELGFCQVQHSVFVHPFICTDQIAYLRIYLGIEDYVTLFTAEDIDNKDALMKRFSL